MHGGSRLIERYVLGAILPYFLLALLLLTGILYAQQSGRFAELVIGIGIPLDLFSDMAFSLLPGVLTFTMPMALLAGVIIGLSRLGSDSELTAMRAAGVGTWRLVWPVLFFGVVISILALYINLWVAPYAARDLRRAALQAALYKLDSPVEPRSFSTEIPGYVVYVGEGDRSRGVWERVFIATETADGTRRLLTARSGRIDASPERSELVLDDADATQIGAGADGGVVRERSAELRLQISTGRAALLDRLNTADVEPEEMGWRELRQYTKVESGAKSLDANALLQRRLSLSIAPLAFALLGAGIGLRVRRGGRGLGMILSLTAMVCYYLVALLGEQMARAGKVPPVLGGWVPQLLALFVGMALLSLHANAGLIMKLSLVSGYKQREEEERSPSKNSSSRSDAHSRARLLNFPVLLDIYIFGNLLRTFALVFVAVTAIFLIFTVFGLWRSIIVTNTPTRMVIEYLIYLLPFSTIQTLPASTLITMLATYAPMVRRSEAVAWWSCGQSSYRLFLPAVLMAVCVGAASWLLQENIMPSANVRQDEIRARIKGGVARVSAGTDRQWLASAQARRIYSYEFNGSDGSLRKLAVFEFDDEGQHLRRAIFSEEAHWGAAPHVLNLRGYRMLTLTEGGADRLDGQSLELTGADAPEVFKPEIDRPQQLSSNRLSAYIRNLKGTGVNTTTLSVSLQRKYVEPFGPVVLAMVSLPMAISFGRRSALMALCLAVAIGLAFWAVSSLFQQAGNYEMLPPSVAAWSPLLIFTFLGIYLTARVRT